MKKIKICVIGLGARYFFAYANWIKTNTDKVELVAVSDIDKTVLKRVGDYHGISETNRFLDYKEMLKFVKGKGIDGMLITTSDKDHYDPAMDSLKDGYHLLLEKPIAPDAHTCSKIINKATECDRIVMVAHVLRYTPFFNCIKKIIDSGVIGKLQTIAHNENILSFHMAHSFVRGNWGNSNTSSPIILAKSCHDLDILQYLIGDNVDCIRVSAFGNLGHFKREFAPEGSSSRCTENCPQYKTCPYSVDIYYHLMKERNGKNSFASVVAPENTPSALKEALKTSRYGRCVYHCDNNVCDHMSSIMEYNNGVTVAFTLTAFTSAMSRTIKVMGSYGEIRATSETDTVDVSIFGKGSNDFRNGDITTYHPLKEATKDGSSSGHDGGDDRFLSDFIAAVGGDKARILTSAKTSLKSHLMAFALEKARVDHKVIDIIDFEKHV